MSGSVNLLKGIVLFCVVIFIPNIAAAETNSKELQFQLMIDSKFPRGFSSQQDAALHGFLAHEEWFPVGRKTHYENLGLLIARQTDDAEKYYYTTIATVQARYLFVARLLDSQPGDRIVGVYHSHPATLAYDLDQTLFSGGSWGDVGMAKRGFSVFLYAPSGDIRLLDKNNVNGWRAQPGESICNTPSPCLPPAPMLVGKSGFQD